ncbi:MAG: nucleoside 2-deoxyribosyltransferase [Candidatus Micrarchaeota archaeon]
MKIFLAGTFRADQEAELLRNLKQKLLLKGHSVWWAMDELGRGYGSEDQKRIKQVVEVEKEQIKNSDAFVSVVKEPTPGTMMEIVFAYENGVPVYLLMSGAHDRIKESPWIKYHAKEIFESEQELLGALDSD